MIDKDYRKSDESIAETKGSFIRGRSVSYPLRKMLFVDSKCAICLFFSKIKHSTGDELYHSGDEGVCLMAMSSNGIEGKL